EQTQIGNFFKQLDDTIALHQREFEKFKILRKAYLKHIFIDNTTQFRAEKTIPWEQRKLGDICNITTGKLDANAMVENGKYDFFTSGIKKYKIDHYAFLGPALTIAGNGATVGYMHYADGFFNAYQRTYVLTELLGDRTFLFSTINRTLQKKIQQEARAGNIPYIVLDMLTELDIYLPSLEEQTQIGNFFKQLDDTIALHQKELAKYQQIKTACLEKMFVE
ncbi:restriction endonuclease subunit S, partial [Haemophilus parahaemolyticus]